MPSKIIKWEIKGLKSWVLCVFCFCFYYYFIFKGSRFADVIGRFMLEKLGDLKFVVLWFLLSKIIFKNKKNLVVKIVSSHNSGVSLMFCMVGLGVFYTFSLYTPWNIFLKRWNHPVLQIHLFNACKHFQEFYYIFFFCFFSTRTRFQLQGCWIS